ncbi:serine protease family S09X [Thraustotheca clavata]|uniref:Serine protease family S09X n=1 Tax=Thraustotheca clavata TaxID=74557 RepID=A0A1W0A4P1_9STRA|nr:serine protease family S09X [Thraustotheca clavata]
MTDDTAENEESSQHPPPGIWATVKYAYDSLVRTVIRPQRSNYTTEDLGPTTCLLARNLVVGRQDITLRNEKGLAVECSWWRRKIPATETPKKEPCIVVLHGNSSCRLGCMDILFHGLAAGFTVFALDFSGSGMSEGKYVSLGYHEKRDIDLVLAYLRESNHVSNIVLWGRSMGAVAALLCAQEDHDITALVLDSPFSCLKQLALDLVDDGKLNVPKFAVSLVMRVLRRDIKRRAKFDMFKLNPIASMDKCMAPSFFAVGEQDELVAPKHVENLHAAHRGPKQLYKFVGGHNSPRPAAFYHEAINFCRVMCGQLPIPQLPDDDAEDDPVQLVEQSISHEELSVKSIRELKKILNEGGIDNSLLSTIVEKSELVDLVLTLQERRLKLALHQRRHSENEDMESTSLSGLERRYSTGSDGISLDNIRPELNDLKPAGVN